MSGKSDQFVLQRQNFPDLLEALRRRGYRLVGPTVREGAIVYDELHSVRDLPEGLTDEQDGGTYRLRQRDDRALFGYNVGPHSLKKFLHPAQVRLWQADRDGSGFTLKPEPVEAPLTAYLGVRACDLQAVAVQNKVFTGGPYVNIGYKTRLERSFIVAVNCGKAGGTCFCASMGTGPQARSGFDLALTEVLEEGRHYFVGETGTERGAEAIRDLATERAGAHEMEAAAAVVARTAGQMGRTLDTSDIKDLLYRNYEHPRWDQVAARCLTCANCTMVCPTCFCTTVDDVTDLRGEHAERWQKWDSCFTLDFSYIHGGSVRSTPRARYRQWMTHKLATWIDQFGTSGCVGCGRCITWCPVAIDITEEVRAIRSTTAGAASKEEPGHGES